MLREPAWAVQQTCEQKMDAPCSEACQSHHGNMGRNVSIPDTEKVQNKCDTRGEKECYNVAVGDVDSGDTTSGREHMGDCLDDENEIEKVTSYGRN